MNTKDSEIWLIATFPQNFGGNSHTGFEKMCFSDDGRRTTRRGNICADTLTQSSRAKMPLTNSRLLPHPINWAVHRPNFCYPFRFNGCMGGNL